MAGRPTDYRPEMCDQVVALGKEGKSIAQIASALDVCKQSLYTWEKEFPEFLDAMTRARQEAQVWWENVGQSALFADKFQASLWAKQVSCRFPDDYREKSQTDIQNLDKNGKPTDPPKTVVEFVNAAHSNPEGV